MTISFRRPALKPLLLSLLLVSGIAFAQGDAGKAARFYEDALKRFERNDFSGAIIQLRNSLQIDKNQLSAHLLLGKALLGDSQVAAAEFEFSEAQRLGVNRTEIAIPLAQALVAQGKQAQVFTDPRLRLDGLPPGIQMQLQLVRAGAASDTGDGTSAMQAILAARAISPNDAASWLAEVPLRIRARQFSEAMAAAEQGIKLSSGSADAFYQKGSVLHVEGNVQAALAAYDSAIKLQSGHVEARLARAGILLDLDRDKEAQADVDELGLLAPKDPRWIYLRSQLASRAGNAGAARDALKQITDFLDPVPIDFIRYRPQVLMLNGMAHYGLNEQEKARPYLELASRLQPNSPLVKLLAQIAMAQPDPGRAIELLEPYLKARPGDGQALLMLATAHMAQGRYAKATALLQEALQAKDSPQFRTALGLSLMRSGKDSSATTELERSFKTDNRQTYAGLALVTLYLRSGQLPKALQVADSLAKANPKNPSILLVQASARFQARDYANAKSGFEAVLKLDGSQLEAKLGLAKVEIATKAFDAADKRLKALLRDDERNVDVLFETATLYEVWGKNDAALKWLESAVDASSQAQTRANFAMVAWQLKKGTPAAAVDAAKVLITKLPDDLAALQVYASAQIANGDLVAARNTLTNASRRAAFEAPVLERIARQQLDAKDIAGAAYSLDKALTGDPNYLPAMALMSSVELLQGDLAKAERRANQITQTYPKASIGYGLLADVALRRGQTAAAVDALRRAHDIDHSETSLLRLLQVLSRQDGGKPAMELAQTWLKTHPQDAIVQKALADAQARSGNFPAARKSYEAALKVSPNDAEALNNLANVLLHQKEPGAAAIAEKALALSPGNPLVIDTAGWANLQAGNRDRALQLLRDARLREPANPALRYHLGAALAQAGRTMEAREELTVALQSKDFDGVQDARALIGTLK